MYLNWYSTTKISFLIIALLSAIKSHTLDRMSCLSYYQYISIEKAVARMNRYHVSAP